MSRRQRHKPPGRLCWCCGEYRANEGFSRKYRVCRACSELGKEEIVYRRHVRDIGRLLTLDGLVRRKKRQAFKQYLAHPDARVRAYAERVKAGDEERRRELRAKYADEAPYFPWLDVPDEEAWFRWVDPADEPAREAPDRDGWFLGDDWYDLPDQIPADLDALHAPDEDGWLLADDMPDDSAPDVPNEEAWFRWEGALGEGTLDVPDPRLLWGGTIAGSEIVVRAGLDDIPF